MHINRQTYEEYFLLYADGELSEKEKVEVEEFIDQNPDLGGELELITQTVMVPDQSIMFANKEILFKEEGNRKVIAMRWMRVAAAAAVLVALTAAGWIFLKDDFRNIQPPVAVIQPEKVPVIDKSNESAPKVIENKEVVAVVKPSSKKITPVPAVQKNKIIEKELKPEEQTTAITNEQPLENTSPEAAVPTNDLAFNEPVADPIDIQVAPREVAQEDMPNTNDAHYTQALEEERAKEDQIYFANTQLSKKTKLRGVFRKASRYLERVTSIQ